MNAAQGVAQEVDGIWLYPLAPSVFPEGTSLRGQMMKMLKLLGLTVFVVCIAAFASGCGGGGGGSAQMPDTTPPVVEPDPEPTEPTDAERIAAARQLLATILTDARSLAQTASSVAAAVQFHPDATAEQVASALGYAADAQSALAAVETARDAGNAAAITLAQAQTAVMDAQAALANLTAAQSAVASLQSALEAVASQRQQMVADETALTNNSSLIKHVRANKLLSDAVLAAPLTTGTTFSDGSIFVGPAGNSGPSSETTRVACTAPCAEFPANIGTGETAVTGQRTVRIGTLVSDSTTPTLTGTGRLPYGFDLDNGIPGTAPTIFINAYTDIAQERRVRNITSGDTDTTPHDERYDYKPDTDYLIAGIWLTVGATLSDSSITAFAYGGQPLSLAPDFCTTVESNTSSQSNTTSRVCANPAATAFSTIGGFVDDGKDVTATYTGDANGAYIAGGDTGYFTADVELTAEFINPTTGDNRGSIQGAVSNISAGGQPMAGSIELQKQPLADDIGAAFAAGMAVGVVDGKSFSGGWKGQFFGQRTTRSVSSGTNAGDPTITDVTTTYTSQAPGSVAGTFYATQRSNPAGEAAFIGAFGAHR